MRQEMFNNKKMHVGSKLKSEIEKTYFFVMLKTKLMSSCIKGEQKVIIKIARIRIYTEVCVDLIVLRFIWILILNLPVNLYFLLKPYSVFFMNFFQTDIFILRISSESNRNSKLYMTFYSDFVNVSSIYFWR